MKSIKKNNKRASGHRIFLAAAVFIIIAACMLLINSATQYKKKYFLHKIYEVNDSLAPPAFSREGGFYNQSFYLRLSSTFKDAVIRYTTDGSSPADTSALYTVPLLVTSRINDGNIISEIPTSPSWRNPFSLVAKGTVIKAALFLKNGDKSTDAVQTFFIHPHSGGRYTLPVVSIATNSNYLFNRDSGIYVMGKTFYNKKYYVKKNFKMSDETWKGPANYNKHGSEHNIPVSVELFDITGKRVFNSPGTARLKGNYSRSHPQKSMLLEMTGNTHEGSIYLSGSLTIKDTHAILLRNSGNDWYHANMRDAVMHLFINNTIRVEKVDFQPVVLFINGEYWGVIYLSENPDVQLLSKRHDIPADSITLFKMDSKFNKEGLPADPCFQYLLDYADQYNFETDSNFNHVMNYFSMEDYTDYIIYQVLLSNIDWPDNNILMWRYNKEITSVDTAFHNRDGRWRMIPYDLDYAFGGSGTNNYTFNMLEFVWKDSYRFNHLFQHFMKNPGYKDYFIQRFKHHLDKTFLPDRLDTCIDYYYKLLKPEMEEHIYRWRYPDTMEEWENEVKLLRRFFSKRKPEQIREFENFFNTRFEKDLN